MSKIGGQAMEEVKQNQMKPVAAGEEEKKQPSANRNHEPAEEEKNGLPNQVLLRHA